MKKRLAIFAWSNELSDENMVKLNEDLVNNKKNKKFWWNKIIKILKINFSIFFIF